MLLKAAMTGRCIFGTLRNSGDQQLEKLLWGRDWKMCETTEVHGLLFPYIAFSVALESPLMSAALIVLSLECFCTPHFPMEVQARETGLRVSRSCPPPWKVLASLHFHSDSPYYCFYYRSPRSVPLSAPGQLSCSSAVPFSRPFSTSPYSDRLSLLLLLTVQQSFLVRCLCLCLDFSQHFHLNLRVFFAKENCVQREESRAIKLKKSMWTDLSSRNIQDSFLVYVIHQVPLFRPIILSVSILRPKWENTLKLKLDIDAFCSAGFCEPDVDVFYLAQIFQTNGAFWEDYIAT